MTASLTRISSALVVAAAFTANAHAEYRCDPAPTWVDRYACKAAEQGPTELRRFVQNMSSLRINLQFADYVDMKTAQNWEEKRRQTAEQNKAAEDAKLASSERR